MNATRRGLVLLVTTGLITLLARCAAGSSEPSGEPDPDGLQAGVAAVPITPTAQNHPETIYLAGVIPSRVATGVHDDLLASALALKQGGQYVILVSLDLVGFTRSRGREIQERVQVELGLDGERVLIAATHTHEGPDTIGVYGANVVTSGTSPTYMRSVQDAVVEAVRQAWQGLVPVTLRAGNRTLHDPVSNRPTLIGDLREPDVTVDHVSVAGFYGLDGLAVATLVNWHSHPEVMIEHTEVSSDFAGSLRQRMEQLVGGRCVYITGAVGGLSTPTGVAVPARDEQGQPVLADDGTPRYLQDASWDKVRSLGFVVAEHAAQALQEAGDVSAPLFLTRIVPFLVPVRTPLMQVAFKAGLVQYDARDLVTDQPDLCGTLGCASERLAFVLLGPLGILSSPGETFPETVVGRPASTVTFGDAGPFPFAAMSGTDALLERLGVSVPMHLGLCGDEIAYLVPEGDLHPPGHPDYYEEGLIFAADAETLYQAAVADLLWADVQR